jgi:hypothetical protein
MSKKPLLSEGTARRWAKYAGIQNESKALLSEMYDKMEEEEDYTEEEEPVEEAMGADDEGEGLEEADNVLAELEAMLAEQDDEPVDEPEGEEDMDDEDMEDMEDEEDEEEMDMEDEEADEEAAGGMDQQAVEDAVKAGLEAMASAIGDALKIKIDVRSGEEIEPEPEAEAGGEEEVMEIMDDSAMEEGDYGMKYEGIDRDELVERVMKRVAARLVKESKSK